MLHFHEGFNLNNNRINSTTTVTECIKFIAIKDMKAEEDNVLSSRSNLFSFAYKAYTYKKKALKERELRRQRKRGEAVQLLELRIYSTDRGR